MGCFLDCFGGGKNRRRQKRRESDQATANNLALESAKPNHVVDREHTVEEIPKVSVDSVTEICPSPTRKRVTFDSTVKTYEHIVLQESVELLEEKKQEEVKSSLELSKTGQSSFENASNSSVTYPSNDRYKNCRESDDDEVEEDELDCIESDFDEDEEYYSDDGFSEDVLHNSTKEVNTEETGDNGLETEDAKSRGVLNPVENLSQWKTAKSKGRTIQKQSQKENANLISDQEDKRESFSFCEDTPIDDISLSFKSKSRTQLKKPRNQKLTTETSLSTWLSKSETASDCDSVNMETSTPEKNKSCCYSRRGISNLDDRPILCALTSEDIKHFSAASTPRKSPSKSPDDTPIIGTVGGYWGNQSKAVDFSSVSSFKGIPNTISKYREDKSVNWHSTPFEARLEKALNNR